MAVNLQDQIEQAWYKALLDVDFDQSTAIKRWRDGTQDVEYPSVVVQAAQVQYGPIVDILWEVVVNLHCLTYTADDTDQSVLNNLYDKVFRRAIELKDSELQANLADIEVKGIFLDAQDAGVEENEQRQTVSMRCHVQADLADASTTTSTTTTTT